jgi:RNA polymerase subunit RPABC4/transcription elongation factor Spt4
MAAKTCKRCGYSPVAYDAICCPHCASSDPHTSKLTLYIWSGLLLVVALGLLAFGNGLLGVLMLIGGLGSVYNAWQK